MGRYYIYRHIRLDKNIPFYIGKGTVAENCVTHSVIYRRAYSELNRNIIWKGIAKRSGCEVEIIYETDCRKEIDRKEIEFIKLYGRIDLGTGSLSNLTSGGDGQYEVSEEAIRRGVEKRTKNGTYKKCSDVNSRPLAVYDKDGVFIKEYKSKRQCASDLHVDLSVVFTAIKEKRMFVGVFFSNEIRDKIDISEYRVQRFFRKKR